MRTLPLATAALAAVLLLLPTAGRAAPPPVRACRQFGVGWLGVSPNCHTRAQIDLRPCDGRFRRGGFFDS